MSGAGRRKNAVRAERRTLRFALLASILFHLGLLVLVRALPPTVQHPTQKPLTFTLVERPARPPQRKPPATGSPGGRPAVRPWPPLALPQGPPGLMAVPDTPRAKETETARGPSLRAMSEVSAQAVVTKRGPQHAPGNSAEARLTESLARGTGAMAVRRSGFWDAYFTLFRKALLKAWVG